MTFLQINIEIRPLDFDGLDSQDRQLSRVDKKHSLKKKLMYLVHKDSYYDWQCNVFSSSFHATMQIYDGFFFYLLGQPHVARKKTHRMFYPTLIYENSRSFAHTWVCLTLPVQYQNIKFHQTRLHKFDHRTAKNYNYCLRLLLCASAFSRS